MIQPTRKGRMLRLLGASSVAAMAFGVLPISPASAALADICPAPGQTDRFTDDTGTTHEANINCAAAYGLVTGTTPTTYNPTGNLTRGQAATMLVNYVERSSGTVLVADATPDFTDTAGNVHAANIEKAADNDILSGFNDRTFRPDLPITRAQFASIAVRATERVLGRALVANATNEFDDDNGSVHESNIEKAVDNGILVGTGVRMFSPQANIQRGQAASILVGAAGNVLQPAGRFNPSGGGVAQAFAVTPSTASTQSTDTGRQFSVTVPAGTGQLVLELFACANIRESDTTFAGSAPGLTGNVGQPGTVGSTITVVNGNPVTAASRILLAATTTGTVTFTVTGVAGQCVVPVVYRDADNSGTVNLGTNNRPTEAFGLGGRTTFVAAQAATATAINGAVSVVDLGADLFQAASAATGGLSSYTYGRAGDIYQLLVGTTCTASTLEAFEQRLSVDDSVTGTYNRAGGSIFCLADTGPQAPASPAASGRTVTFSNSPTATTASYNVYRAAGIPEIIGSGTGATCPALTSATAYTVAGTVADTSLLTVGTGTYTFSDTAAAAGSLQCYAVASVDRTGDVGPLAAAGTAQTIPAADTTAPSFASATAVSGTRTVTVTYNEAIRCNTVAPNGSDFQVRTSTAGGFLNVNAPTAALCVGPSATGTSNTVVITVTNLITDTSLQVISVAGADGNTVLDVTGNAQAAGQIVVGAVTGGGGGVIDAAPTFTSASVVNGTLVMTVGYSESLNCTTVSSADYAVTFATAAGGTVTTIPTANYTATCSGSTVTLTFTGTPFATGNTGSVTKLADGVVTDVAGVEQVDLDAETYTVTAAP